MRRKRVGVGYFLTVARSARRLFDQEVANLPKHIWHGHSENAIAHAESSCLFKSRILQIIDLRLQLPELPRHSFPTS